MKIKMNMNKTLPKPPALSRVEFSEKHFIYNNVWHSQNRLLGTAALYMFNFLTFCLMNSIKKLLWYRLYFTRLIFFPCSCGQGTQHHPRSGTPNSQLPGFQKCRCTDPLPQGGSVPHLHGTWNIRAWPPPSSHEGGPPRGQIPGRRCAQFCLLSLSPVLDLSTTADTARSAECRQLKPGAQGPLSCDEVTTSLDLWWQAWFPVVLWLHRPIWRGQSFSPSVYSLRTRKSYTHPLCSCLLHSLPGPPAASWGSE